MATSDVRTTLQSQLAKAISTADASLHTYLEELIEGREFPYFGFADEESAAYRTKLKADTYADLVVDLAFELCDLAAGRVMCHSTGKRSKKPFEVPPPARKGEAHLRKLRQQARKRVGGIRRQFGATRGLVRQAANVTRFLRDVQDTPPHFTDKDVEQFEGLLARAEAWLLYREALFCGYDPDAPLPRGRPPDRRRMSLERELMHLFTIAGMAQRQAAKHTDKFLLQYGFIENSRWEAIEQRHIKRRKAAIN